MGDFSADTAVDGADGEYRARLSRDWEIWGPNGGYLCAVVLRALGEHSRFARPATLTVHFLGVAAFDEVTLHTETLRSGKRSESVRISMRQDGRPICEAMAWTVSDDATGPEFDWTSMPDVPPPSEVPTIQEWLGDDAEPPFRFWDNFEFRPIDFMSQDEWMTLRPLDPRVQAWFKFVPSSRFDDPYVEAGRVAVLLDTEGWPAAARALTPETNGQWMAPNMEVSMCFHEPPAPGDEYLLCDMTAPRSSAGLVGAYGTAWSPDGRLLGSGIQQMLYRPVPPVPTEG